MEASECLTRSRTCRAGSSRVSIMRSKLCGPPPRPSAELIRRRHRKGITFHHGEQRYGSTHDITPRRRQGSVMEVSGFGGVTARRDTPDCSIV